MGQQDRSGLFLTIEGVEGVGKTTAVKFIEKYLKTRSIDYLLTREPGGTEIAERIREVLLSPHHQEIMHADTEMLLMFAARNQHVLNCILPGLHAGKLVISDRFIDASFAYQGGGRGIDLSRIETLEKWVLGNLHPHVTILLDAPPALGLARAKNRGPHDRIEQEKIDFFDQVRAAYLARAKKDPKRFRVIDATQPLHAVHANIQSILDTFLGITQ